MNKITNILLILPIITSTCNGMNNNEQRGIHFKPQISPILNSQPHALPAAPQSLQAPSLMQGWNQTRSQVAVALQHQPSQLSKLRENFISLANQIEIRGFCVGKASAVHIEFASRCTQQELAANTAALQQTLKDTNAALENVQLNIHLNTGVEFPADLQKVTALSETAQAYYFEKGVEALKHQIQIDLAERCLAHNQQCASQFALSVKEHSQKSAPNLESAPAFELTHTIIPAHRFQLSTVQESLTASEQQLTIKMNELAALQKQLDAGSQTQRLGWRSFLNSENDKQAIISKINHLDAEIKKIEVQRIKLEKEAAFIKADIAIAEKAVQKQLVHYLYEAQQIQAVLEEMQKVQKLTNPEMLIFESLKQTVADLAAPVHAVAQELTDRARDLLKYYAIPIEVFKAQTGTAFQKVMLEQIYAVVNETAEIAAACSGNSHVLPYIEATLRLSETAAIMAQSGIVREVLGIVAVINETFGMLQNAAPQVLTGMINGVQKGAIGSIAGQINMALHPIESMHHVGSAINRGVGIVQRLLEGNPITQAKLLALAKTLQEMPLEKQAEEITALITSAFIPTPFSAAHKFVSVSQTAQALNKVLKVELEGLKALYKVETSAAKTINGTLVPERYAKEIDALVRSGKYSTPQEITSFIERAEAPLFHSLKAAISDVKQEAVQFIGTATKSMSTQQLIELSLKLDAAVGDIPKLQKAIERFAHVPGAVGRDGPITKLLENGIREAKSGSLSVARGHAFELERALELELQGEKVIGFGIKHQYGSAIKEFDIVTPTKLIECKNIEWSIADINYFKDQIGTRASIANGLGKVFELHSKKPVPEAIKSWLTFKKITVVE